MNIKDPTTAVHDSSEANKSEGGSDGSDAELEIRADEEHRSHHEGDDLQGEGIGLDSSRDETRYTWSWEAPERMHFDSRVLNDDRPRTHPSAADSSTAFARNPAKP